ncbi:hypothetical protein AD998_05555 [bacterium 336/3]|nr:hypothetical protein AD998_05555 [bacterium 336/3]
MVMKKIALSFVFALISLATFAQDDTGFKLGFKIGTPIAFNSVKSTENGIDASPNGASLRFMAGPIADIVWTERYALTTGILFTTKQANYQTQVAGIDAINEKYGLQYIQIPVGLKLFTDELFTNGKGYVNFGIQPEILVGNSRKSGNYVDGQLKSASLIRKFSPLDIGMFIGAGVEYQLGNNPIFGGIGYQRSFINSVSSLDAGAPNFLSIKQNLFVIEVGIKL